MKKIIEFVSSHINEDTIRLILDKDKYPEIDIELAVNCIESRRKLRHKVPEWYNEPELIFPASLSAEQCSSSATGQYKAELAEKIASVCHVEQWRIADLTGGLGVDSWFFSKKATEVIYNEMKDSLCKAAIHNFSILGVSNISVRNITVEKTKCREILADVKADIVYLDPARRNSGGKKVFLIEECTPDVLSLKDEIFTYCRHILLKLSPMADISMVCNRLGSTCREIHIVASDGECKELLIWMDREWNDYPSITAAELHSDIQNAIFTFTQSEEKSATPSYCGSLKQTYDRHYLFEPGRSLMKAGAFNIMSAKLGISKLGKSTHYYITDSEDTALQLKAYGKVFSIIRCSALDRKNMKETGKEYPSSDVTARNIPMDSDTLRKKIGVSSGNRFHIFGLKSDIDGNLLIVSERI